VVLIIAALCLFLAYISSYIDPAKTSIPLFFGLYYIPILIVNIILFIIALLSRSKSAWISIIALLPTLLFAERFYKIASHPEEASGNTIRLETYNVGNFVLSKKGMSSTAVMDGIANQIQKDDPDIVCFQEVYLRNKSQISKTFPGYRYKTFHFFNHSNGRVSGNVILSKYRIINGGVLRFKGSTNLAVYADIVIQDDTIRVYNNHLESYAISLTALVKRIREKRKSYDKLSSEIINIHTKVRNTVIRRSKQVSVILSDIQKSPYPAVICGDLNDIPMSYTYHKLSHGKNDTFRESGKGFSATYSAMWPLLRIDYVFIPKSFASISHKTLKYDYSDHYPVLTEFSVSGQ